MIKKICLIGDTKHYEHFKAIHYAEEMKGHIVLAPGYFPSASLQAHGIKIRHHPQQMSMLADLQLRRIDLADEVLVINVDEILDDKTMKEIAYAQAQGKVIRYRR